MTPREPFDHLRHAALDLLESGNSTASVSQLLAVPPDVIVRWRDEPVPPRLDPAARLLALGAAGHAPHFSTTLVVRRCAPGDMWRHALQDYVVCGLLLVMVMMAIRGLGHGGAFGSIWIDVTPLFGLGVLWLRRNQVLFKLDDRGIVVPRLFGSERLSYADLADWWLVMHVQGKDTDEEVEGRKLTLHSRRKGAPPIELFVADYVHIDQAVIERLDLVKTANQGVRPLTPVRSIPKTPAWGG
ncbi:MAG TPA: hypothetical protein VIN75_20575 [Burkholderiaceae bacterium]